MTGPGPLCRAVAEGRVATPAELKTLWRSWVRKTHPDAGRTSDSQGFTDLTADYDLARELLARRASAPEAAPRPELIDVVCDLVASGFPAPDRARRSNAAYRRRLGVLAELWRARGGDSRRLEVELETLRAPGPVANPGLGELQEYLYLVVAHHHQRFAYVRAQLDRALPVLAAACRARGHGQTARFVEALAPQTGG